MTSRASTLTVRAAVAAFVAVIAVACGSGTGPDIAGWWTAELTDGTAGLRIGQPADDGTFVGDVTVVVDFVHELSTDRLAVDGRVGDNGSVTLTIERPLEHTVIWTGVFDGDTAEFDVPGDNGSFDTWRFERSSADVFNARVQEFQDAVDQFQQAAADDAARAKAEAAEHAELTRLVRAVHAAEEDATYSLERADLLIEDAGLYWEDTVRELDYFASDPAEWNEGILDGAEELVRSGVTLLDDAETAVQDAVASLDEAHSSAAAILDLLASASYISAEDPGTVGQDVRSARELADGWSTGPYDDWMADIHDQIQAGRSRADDLRGQADALRP